MPRRETIQMRNNLVESPGIPREGREEDSGKRSHVFIVNIKQSKKTITPFEQYIEILTMIHDEWFSEHS